MASMYHEPVEELQQQTRDITRAIQSMKEELDAIDWYNQRATSTQDQSLKNLLIHNRDEEIEHAAMLMEWLRRLMPEFDQELRTYLFTQGPLETIEETAEGGAAAESAPDESASSAAGGSTAPTEGRQGTGDLGIGRMS
jgi:hypothetical protein